MNRQLAHVGFEFDWNDELHPTNNGFRRIAKKFESKIRKLL